jgi:hypothetical protein
MTAQVALMNKSAIALATDSAVTINTSGGDKIYNTVNKLFTLSKYYPIGIMIYGSAQFMGIPWESVIKIYRKQLKDKPFSSLKEYSDDFINFLKNSQELINVRDEVDYFRQCFGGYLSRIEKEIDNKVKERLKNKNRLSKKNLQEISDNIIEKHFDDWQNESKLEIKEAESFIKQSKKLFSKEIKSFIESIFEKYPLSVSSKRKLEEFAIFLFSKDRFRNNSSGIVIAGFGEQEIFPSLVNFSVEGRIKNYLKYKLEREFSTNTHGTASIIPFAQTEMVHTFMEGVNPIYQRNVVDKFVQGLIDNYPKLLIEKLTNISDADKQKLKELFASLTDKIYKDFEKELRSYREQHFINPIMSIVDFLPKDELAAMAESLVNLTSFRRHVSLDSETVGGPIDVAVISKGDGFIWIKRKHYFKPELNQNFVRNYYRN